MRAKFVQLFALIAVIAPFLGVANLALADKTPPRATFTVTVASALARGAPDLATPSARPVFAGQTFGLRARTADSLWLQIDSPDGEPDVWVLAAWGTISGSLARLPVIGVRQLPSPPARPAVEEATIPLPLWGRGQG